MRELKFRAWDKKYQLMVEPDSITAFDTYLTLSGEVHEVGEYSNYGGGGKTVDVVTDQYELLQFTGLKDKNGKEIYEGDIVQIDNTDEVSKWFRGKKALVECKPGRFRILIESGEANMMKEDMSNVIEVIGNIYEHPHLLNQE